MRRPRAAIQCVRHRAQLVQRAKRTAAIGIHEQDAVKFVFPALDVKKKDLWKDAV